MAKSNNSSSRLLRNKPPTDLIAASRGNAGPKETSTKITAAHDLRPLSIGSKETVTSIRFGSPSSPNSGSTAAGTGGAQWTKLLQQAASGGAASALSGASGFGAFGGLGSIISGIFKLFGGGSHSAKTLPPLVEFKLANPETQSVYIGSNRSTAGSPGVNTPTAPDTVSGIYTNSGQITNISSSRASGGTNQSAQIVQTVKNALLTSSSLNDVIAEL